MSTPAEIIEAFDRCLIYVYGAAFARDNPNKTDIATAKPWIEAGADVVVVSWVFFDRMSWMHEKHLRSQDKKDRTNIPGTLKVFDENVMAALRRMNGSEIDAFETRLSLWRSRMKGWKKYPNQWRVELWGPQPFQPGCRVPALVLREAQDG
jgi:hypothetical protein